MTMVHRATFWLYSGHWQTHQWHLFHDQADCRCIYLDRQWAWPLPISPEEIALLRKLIDDTDAIRLSRVTYEGMRITVVDGPLKGQEAIIRKVDHRKGRVKIALNVLGTERLVDISVEDVG